MFDEGEKEIFKLFEVKKKEKKKWQGAPGFEPGTSRSAVECSTTELYPHTLSSVSHGAVLIAFHSTSPTQYLSSYSSDELLVFLEQMCGLRSFLDRNPQLFSVPTDSFRYTVCTTRNQCF